MTACQNQNIVNLLRGSGRPAALVHEQTSFDRRPLPCQRDLGSYQIAARRLYVEDFNAIALRISTSEL